MRGQLGECFVDEQLNLLSDVQRQTVELINTLAEDEGLSYADLTVERIKQTRFDAGMAKGSNTDVMKIKNKWAEIYGIDSNSVNNLVKPRRIWKLNCHKHVPSWIRLKRHWLLSNHELLNCKIR